MFINFWYVAAESSEVTYKPVKTTMLGQEFVLWRDKAGKVNCISNTCTHRGGAMAEGRIQGDCIECPYHGWTFNGEGECVRLPSIASDKKIPARAHIDAYPVEEKYGLIFTFLGDLPEEERPPIIDIPEYDDEKWICAMLKVDWKIDYKRSLENTMDPAHNEFTHPTHGFLGVKDEYTVADITLIEKEWGTGFMNPMYTPPLANEAMREASGRTEDAWSEAGAGNHGVNCTWTFIHPTEKASMHNYMLHTPIHEKLDRIYVLMLRNFLTEERHNQTFIDRGVFIAEQDRVVLETINPILTPRANTKEVLVPADKAVARYRELYREWQAKGWRIDVKKMHRDEDEIAYAIPSPGRRKSKNWALDAVPLIPGDASESLKTAAE